MCAEASHTSIKLNFMLFTFLNWKMDFDLISLWTMRLIMVLYIMKCGFMALSRAPHFKFSIVLVKQDLTKSHSVYFMVKHMYFIFL